MDVAPWAEHWIKMVLDVSVWYCWYLMVLNGIAWYCLVFDDITLYLMVSYGIQWYSMVS